MRLFTFILAFGMALLATPTAAQTTSSVEPVRKGAFDERVEAPTTTADKIPEYYRHHKKLPVAFEGYAIELTTSAMQLPRNYALFERFGSIYVTRQNDGSYAYLITGYPTKHAAEDHFEKVVIHQAPEARIVKYKAGKIVQ